MSKKLWQTGSSLHPLVEAYTVGDDWLTDQHLLPYDIAASKAHAEMLLSIGILTMAENAALQNALDEAQCLWEKGEFKILPEQEDGHTALEQFLTEKCGEAGKKIHTGRSRNDQAMVMIRLFLKEEGNAIAEQIRVVENAFRDRAQTYHACPMPGYTHMQKAMPTTVGKWLSAFADGFADILPIVQSTLAVIDQNPLGSAAGFGIDSLQLDREQTTRLLGFRKVQENPMYCGLSRGSFEYLLLSALSPLMILSSRFASDMMLFTMQETAFFALPDEFTTGSSIMPQKRNYDLFEIMRGNVRVFEARKTEIFHIISGLGSGYHRDLQLTKKPTLEAISLCSATLKLLAAVLPELIVRTETLQKAMTKELFATEAVYQKVAAGMPFRDAYLEVKKTL